MKKNVPGKKTKIIEKSRTYYYPNEFRRGELMKSTFLDVIKVVHLPSGSYRIYTADGKTHFVNSGFIKCDVVQAKKEG